MLERIVMYEVASTISLVVFIEVTSPYIETLQEPITLNTCNNKYINYKANKRNLES